jgi:hypothetical protein
VVPFHKSLSLALGVGRDGTPSGQACTASSGQTFFKNEQYTMFNKVILIGRLGKSAEAKTAHNKKDCAVLNLATSKSWKNDLAVM